jgi:hypothetical protein
MSNVVASKNTAGTEENRSFSSSVERPVTVAGRARAAGVPFF